MSSIENPITGILMNILRLIYVAMIFWANNVLADYCADLDYSSLSPKISDAALKDERKKACNVLPNSPEKAIVAYVAPNDAVSKRTSSYQLVIILVEIKTNKVVKYVRDGVFDELPSDISIDVAKYYVNMRQRAFGIRIGSNNYSRLSPYVSQELRLYLDTQHGLVNILKGLEVYHLYGFYDDVCESSSEIEKKTLSMLGGKSEGFADIAVTSKIETAGQKMEGDECKAYPSTLTSSRQTLKYSSGEYR